MDLQQLMQSVPITTYVMSLNPTHGEVYSIQKYVMKFESYSWWGALDTKICDEVWILLMVRCTRYKNMWWSLNPTHGEVYSIQKYVMKFESYSWWGVLDTKICDEVWILLMVRYTRYKNMWWSLNPTHGEVYSIQKYVMKFESYSWWGVLDTKICDEVCQWLATGQWFSPGTPVSFTNKTYHHDIAELLLKVSLNT